MLKLLQAQSQRYFSSRQAADIFASLTGSKQKMKYYMMLILRHMNSIQTMVQHLGEAASNRTLDSSSLLAAIWAVSLQVDQKGEEAKKIYNLVVLIQARNIVDRSQLLADLPQWVAQGSGLIEQSAYDKKLARVYTKINYEQSKYSLMRENNEGYSKLTLLLVNLRDSHDIGAVWKKIVSLVGNFDLDPDRVLDLIIEARIQNHTTNNYLLLLVNFRKESITVVLGNKLKLQKGKPIDQGIFERITYGGAVQNFDSSTPEEVFNEVGFVPNPYLISFTAQLIKANIVTYSDMLVYLDPPDNFIRNFNCKKLELATLKISKCFTLNMEEIDDAEKNKQTIEENLRFEGQLLHSSKLALISELVRINNWKDFIPAWAPFKGKLDLLLYQHLLRYLLNLIEWTIEPLIQNTISFQRFFKFDKKQMSFVSDNSPKQFYQMIAMNPETMNDLCELLSYVGPYISFRQRLFIKLCRYLKILIKEQNSPYAEQVKYIILNYLMPGTCLAESNGPIALQLYNLLECFDYHFRYGCYLNIYQQGMTGGPFVARIFQQVKRKQNIIVNNLSKENKKLFTRKITKLTHNQALPVFYWIVRRIVMADYEAVVPEIVAVLTNSTPLTLDMAIFVMLYTLNEHRQPSVNAKTRQFQPWFKNIITFISNFFRKYLEADIQPVFDYIIMKTGLPIADIEDQGQLPGALLKLLHEIFNKMNGSVMIQDLDKKKIDLIAVGPRLQFQMLELTSEVRAAKKSKVILQKFFWEQNMDHHDGLSIAFNLLVLLAQKRSEVLTKSFIDDLKIIGQIYDEYTLLIIQIVRILLYQAQDFNHYNLLLPKNPIRVLLSQYKIPLQIVCEIVRPGIKHISTMTNDEWSAFVKEFSSAYKDCLKDSSYLLKSRSPNQKIEVYLNTYKERVQQILPAHFFTSFWFLTIDSIYFPAKSYSDKIQQLKKKIEYATSKKNDRNQRNDRQVERMRALYDKLVKEEEAQRKKSVDTLSEDNLKKFQIDVLSRNDRDKDKERKENSLLIFSQLFVQVCLLPRMMLDRAQAYYCVKFTIEMIKVNKMAATKSIRLLTFLIEYVMSYLPFTTQREAANCISIFMSEILSIFNNWNDPIKLKLDIKRILGAEDSASGKDNYNKLKEYLVRLFERVGNTVRSIREEPCIIKNCLYLLEKVDSIPSYKEQAQELEQHMKNLKEMYSTVDMRTILDRQIAILSNKKMQLPDKPEEKKVVKPVQVSPVPLEQIDNSKVTIKQSGLSVNKTLISRSPINFVPNNNGARKDNNISAPNDSKNNRQTKRDEKNYQKVPEKFTYEDKSRGRQENRFTTEKIERKSQPREKREDTNKIRPQTIKTIEGATSISNPSVAPIILVQQHKLALQIKSITQNKNIDKSYIQPIPLSAVPPPLKTVKDLKNQQKKQFQQKGVGQFGQSSSVGQISLQAPMNQMINQKDNSISAAKPSQEQNKILIVETNLTSQKLLSSTNAEQLKFTNRQESQKRDNLQRLSKQEGQKDQRQYKDSNKIIVDKDNHQVSRLQKNQMKRTPSISPDNKRKLIDHNRWKDKSMDNKIDRERQESKGKSLNYNYNRDRKSEERREDIRKQQKRERQREKEKQRKHDKYNRSRSRERYGRR